MSKSTKQPTIDKETNVNATVDSLQSGNTSTIADLWIENFNYDELEPESKSKKYSGSDKTVTDTGQDNPFWNVSLLVRLGGYCATAENSYNKGIKRRGDIETQLENGKDWYADDSDGPSIYQQNEATIENAEADMLRFRDIYEEVLGMAWEGAEKHKAKLDAIFNPATLGSMGSGSIRKTTATDALINIRSKASGRSFAEQKAFEQEVDSFIFNIKTVKIPANLCKIPKSEATKIFNALINKANEDTTA